MIPPKALAAQWHSTRLNLGVQGWRGRVKPLQQDKGRCHGQAPKAAGGREGMAIKKHHCASTGCFLSTMSWPCWDTTTAWDTLGPSLCRLGTQACTHQPSPFSVLTKLNNFPEANFSQDAGQEAPELHLPALGRAGRISRT